MIRIGFCFIAVRQHNHNMPHNDGPSFLSPPAAGPWSWRVDCQPRLHDVPRAEQAGLLLQVARNVYAAHFNDPLRAEALALSQAGYWLAVIRHDRSDSAAIAAELGVQHVQYQAAMRVARHEDEFGGTLKSSLAYDRFRDELNTAVNRVRPGPEQLRALAAALTDRSAPNQLWVQKFLRNGVHHDTAIFMANLQEKLARELPLAQRRAFLRDCEDNAQNVRRLVLLFRDNFSL